MRLKYDRPINIAGAKSRTAKRWRNLSTTWAGLVEACSKPVRTDETAEEYRAMDKARQSEIKDVGGFVGGYLQGGVRKTANVISRDVATLDIDYGTPDFWDDFTLSFDWAALLYSTHKHTPQRPRYRLILPLSRTVTPKEYEPLVRKLAQKIGMDLFDDTTYELARLFYWPSIPKDVEPVFEYQDGPFVDVDKVLSEYGNPYDVSEWPVSSREGTPKPHALKNAEDPTTKGGVIGAFCKAYPIEEAIETFLSEVYTPTAVPGRYTYAGGSVAGGLICYEGKWAYSHHETDPASRKLCNAFDLVRIHKFGNKDTDGTESASFDAMRELAASDPRVKREMIERRAEEAKNDFAKVENGANDPDTDEKSLKTGKTGEKRGKKSTINDFLLVLDNDPNLKGKLRYNEFTGFAEILKPLPWRAGTGQWTDRDDACLRHYMEEVHDLTGREKLYDAFAVLMTKHSYHPIREYLDSLNWDGVQRLDRLIIKYLGAEDNELTRAMTRKHFTAAVARIYKPGVKYDQCLIMTGQEGVGKSNLLSIMGGQWFNDSVVSTEGKEGMEQLRRAWIIEMGELASIKRADVAAVKSYLSRQVDSYRAAYARISEDHPRQCVFCGTTNEDYFLKGDTGNRRYWVIKILPALRDYPNWPEAKKDLEHERDQIWAEAVTRYGEGEPLYLPENLEREARARQAEYNDEADDPIMPELLNFLDMRLPYDWKDWNIQQRRNYLNAPDELAPNAKERRERVCAAEFVSEVLLMNKGHKDYPYATRKINKLIKKLPDWKEMGPSQHCYKWYGLQRSFKRVKTDKNHVTKNVTNYDDNL